MTVSTRSMILKMKREALSILVASMLAASSTELTRTYQPASLYEGAKSVKHHTAHLGLVNEHACDRDHVSAVDILIVECHAKKRPLRNVQSK